MPHPLRTLKSHCQTLSRQYLGTLPAQSLESREIPTRRAQRKADPRVFVAGEGRVLESEWIRSAEKNDTGQPIATIDQDECKTISRSRIDP
jgi:hypothetical protein